MTQLWSGLQHPRKGTHSFALCSLQPQCDDSVSGAFDSPDATSRECGPDSDMFQRCCARAQSKEVFPRRPFHQCVGLDLSCDLMWLQAGSGGVLFTKEEKEKTPDGNLNDTNL